MSRSFLAFLKQQNKAFWLAIQFLTRLPTPNFSSVSAQNMGQAISYFPLVGLIIGGLLWLLMIGLSGIAEMTSQGLSAEVIAGILLLFWAWVTGGLHLDGLADSCDGWLGATGNPKRALEIMKDSRIGTGGGVALIVVLLLKWALLTQIVMLEKGIILLFVPLLARVASIALMPVTPYMSQAGLAESMFNHLSTKAVLFWVVLSIILLLALHWGLALAVLLFWLWIRRWMQTLTGGMTGDTAGAMTELMETFLMLILLMQLPILPLF